MLLIKIYIYTFYLITIIISGLKVYKQILFNTMYTFIKNIDLLLILFKL